MKIHRNKMVSFVLLSIMKYSLDYIKNRNDQGKNIFFIEKKQKTKKFNFCGIAYFVIINTFNISV